MNSLNGCATFGLGIIDTFHKKKIHDILPHLTKPKGCAHIYCTAGYGLQLDRSFRFQTTTCTHLQVEITEIQHTFFFLFSFFLCFLTSFFLSFFLLSSFFFFLSFFLSFFFLSFFFLSFVYPNIFIYCTYPNSTVFESVLNFIKQFLQNATQFSM